MSRAVPTSGTEFERLAMDGTRSRTTRKWSVRPVGTPRRAIESVLVSVPVGIDQLDGGNALEDRVLGGEPQLPGDRHGGDPPISLVILGAETVTGTYAPRPKLDVGIGHLGQGRNHAGSGDESIEDGAPSCSPTGDLGSEPHLGHHRERKHPHGWFEYRCPTGLALE